jgi:hypothetical protein
MAQDGALHWRRKTADQRERSDLTLRLLKLNGMYPRPVASVRFHKSGITIRVGHESVLVDTLREASRLIEGVLAGARLERAEEV